MQISEPVTAHVILPFIVQVSTLHEYTSSGVLMFLFTPKLLSETGITEGDITKVGYYTGFVVGTFLGYYFDS